MDKTDIFTYQSSMNQYVTWQKTNDIKFISPRKGALLDDELRDILGKELTQLRTSDIAEFMLRHKYHEVQSFVSKVGIEVVNEVNDLLYRPTSIDDFEKIEPELVYVHEQIELTHTNIFGRFFSFSFFATIPQNLI